MCGFYLSGNRRQILIEIDKIELNMKISRSNEKIRKTKVDNCVHDTMEYLNNSENSCKIVN